VFTRDGSGRLSHELNDIVNKMRSRKIMAFLVEDGNDR
jgi:hypothetical protein